MTSPAGQTVTFVAVTLTGEVDAWEPTVERTPTDVEGCLFRSLNATETAELQTDVATEVWCCTAPPVSAALTADATGELQYDSKVFHIIGGAKLMYDFDGNLDHVVVLAQRHEG